MSSNQMGFITVGRIIATQGVRGKLKLEVTTEFPQRFKPSGRVYIDRQAADIESVEWRKGTAIIKLDTINSLEEAKKTVGKMIEIAESQLWPLPEGQYYHFQIIGLEVWTTRGELLGKVSQVLNTPSNDNYVVSGANEEILIPAIEDVIVSIEPDKGYITIEPIEGLLTLNKKAAR